MKKLLFCYTTDSLQKLGEIRKALSSVAQMIGGEHMKKFFRLLQSRMFRRLFIPVLIILLTVTTVLTVYFFSMQYRQNHAKWMEQTFRATQAAEKFHNLISQQVENIGLIIQFNEHDLFSTSNAPAGLALAAYDYMHFLNMLQMSGGIVDSIWIHFPLDHLVYTSWGTCYADDDPLFDGLLDAQGDGGWIYPRTITTVSNQVKRPRKTYLTYTARLWSTDAQAMAMIYMNVDAANLYEMLKNLSGLNELVILDEKGKVALCSDPTKIGSVFTDSDAAIAQTKQELQSQGTDFFAVSIQGQRFIYQGFLSLAYSNQEIQLLLLYMSLVLGACFFFCLVLCGIVSARIYNPLTVLMRDFEEKNAHNDSTTVPLVQQTLLNMAKKNDVGFEVPDMNENTESFEAITQDNVTGSMMAHLDSFDSFILMMVEIDEPLHCKQEANKLTPCFEQLIRSFLRQLVDKGEGVYTVFLHSGLVAAIISLSHPERMQDVPQLMASLQEMLHTVNACTVSCACSRMHQGQENVSKALAEAGRAMYWKLREKPGCRIFYEERMDMTSGFVFPQAEIYGVLSALEQGNEEYLRKVYRDFIASLKETSADVDDLVLVFYQLLGQIIQTLTRRHIKVNRLFNEPESSPYRYLSSFEFMDHMADWLEEKLVLLWRECSTFQPAGSIYINTFQKYMNEHYMNKLIPEEVAAQLGISYSYLRKLLNSELNTSFSSYLLSLRLHHTRKLLLHTALTQKEIAEQVGFGSEQTLYRVFRQNEGCSPGEWRKEHGAFTNKEAINEQEEQ